AGFVQSIAGAGNASHLTLNIDGNDQISFSSDAVYMQNGNDYTFYSDTSMTQTVGQLTLG
ncbi:MAG: hypothetical protein VW935_14710, partial [Novosphingobium sp.]